MVERAVLAAAVQSFVGKLPPELIDRHTALAKNNLPARCRINQASFLSVLRSPGSGSEDLIRVRYRPTRDGRGAFTWYWQREG